jgi:site-specific DNA recombinase
MPSLPSLGPSLTPQRAAVYARVSSKEQIEGYSLDAQHRACREFCQTRRYTVIQDYADQGISAHTDMIAKRPQFAQMLADAEAGRFDVIVVHKMDRFARKLRLCLEVLEQLGRARVGVVSVSEPSLDYSTPQGFLFLTMLGGLAEWYSRNLAVETRKGWRERKLQGLYGGRLPYGVVKGEDGVPIPDTTPIDVDGRATNNHAGLLLAFERAAAGATDTEVAEALNTAGYRPKATARRARFTRDSTRTILANRFYVGELPVGKRGAEGWMPGVHEPIVPLDLFGDVQRQRARRATQPSAFKVARSTRTHALSGLVRCAACGELMHLEGGDRLYCWGRRQAAGCRAPSVASRVIEDELGDYFGQLQLPDDAREQILAAYQSTRPEVDDRRHQRARLESQLRKLGDLYVLSEMDKSEYEARRQELRTELGRLEETDAHGSPAMLQQLQDYLLNAADAWRDFDGPHRNQLARALFEVIMVDGGHLQGVRPRPEFQPYLVLAQETTRPPHQNGETAVSLESSRRRARGDSNPRSPA